MALASDTDLLAGTLDMLVLRTLTLGSLHGYAIAQQLDSVSKGALRVQPGSLYPALERLLGKGFVTSRWATSPTGRQARYYTITASGRRKLSQKTADYERITQGIARVLRNA
jgi:PadR family transcriptional regulator